MHLFSSQLAAPQDCVSVGEAPPDWYWIVDPVDLDCGYSTVNSLRQGCAIRFLNIDIPKGAHIAIANLLLCAWADYDKDYVRSYINAELNADPQPFTTIADYWARPRTVLGTAWDQIRHFKDRLYYSSPNFASHIQQVIDLPDWAPGKNIVIFWNDHGNRSDNIPGRIRHAYGYHVEPARAPYLRITYTLPDEIKPPPVPGNMWAIEEIHQYKTATGYIIVVITDRPCHLYMRWSTNPPQQHAIPVERRGLFMHADKYFCFTAYEDNEQIEQHDTIVHTFIKEPWPVCETRWFYFHSNISGDPSPSTSPIFDKHRTALEWTLLFTEPWTYYEPPPPGMELLFIEPWSA